jgi:hypothetical protein
VKAVPQGIGKEKGRSDHDDVKSLGQLVKKLFSFLEHDD